MKTLQFLQNNGYLNSFKAEYKLQRPDVPFDDFIGRSGWEKGTLMMAFSWSDSNAGFDYWSQVYSDLIDWIEAPKSLREFLTEKGVLAQFVREFEVDERDADEFLEHEAKADKSKTSYTISGAFTWKKTRAGHQFWSDLNKEYKALNKA